MRKKFNQSLAVVLSAVMTVSSPLAVYTARAEQKQTEIEVPQPAYVYDFEGDTSWQSKGTVSGANSAMTPVVEGGAVEIIQDGENNNHVLRISDGGAELFGKNFAKLPENVFGGITAESGLTVSMKVNIDAQKNLDASSIIYSTPEKYGTWGLFKMKANLVMNINAGNPQVYGDTPESQKTTEHFGSWHTVTITLKKEGAVVYLDGVEKTNTAATGGDKANGFTSAITAIAANKYNVLGGGGFPSGDKTSTKDISEIMYDDIEIYTSALTSEQVYKMVTGGEAVDTDKTALAKTIEAAQKIGRLEIYTQDSTLEFKRKLEAAVTVNADIGADQDAVDTANSELAGALAGLVKKDINLLSGLRLNADFTNPSVMDSEKGIAVSGGYQITPLGNSTLGESSIQSSVDGESGKAGVSLDKDLLLNTSLEEGLTFHVKWKFSSIYTEKEADFWNLIAITDSSGGALLRNTIGYITAFVNTDSDKATWLYPNPDCKNGFAWDSCKKYSTGEIKHLTFTIDKTGCRSYVDGVLACVKTSVSNVDYARILAEAEDITIGRDSGGTHGDIMGELCGVQVYNRALNEAEVDELAKTGLANNEVTYSAEINAKKGSKIELKKAQTSLYTIMADENGKAVLKGLKKGEEYNYVVTLEGCMDVTGAFIVDETNTQDVTEQQIEYLFALDKTQLEINKGETGEIGIKADAVIPEGTTIESAVSSDTNIATVLMKEGKVVITGVAPGEARITVTGSNKKTAVVIVNVKSPLTGIVFKQEAVTVENKKLLSDNNKIIYGKAALEIGYIPEDTTDDKTINYTSSNIKVATVDANGVVTAAAESGTVVITAKTVNGKTAECTVTVKTREITGALVDNITLNKTEAQVEEGKTIQLTAVITPEDAAIKECEWKSSNPDVAKVDASGLVTALMQGTATITATTTDGTEKSASCTVTVNPAKIAVTDISLDKTTLSLEEGAEGRLTALIYPTNATVKAVTWSTDAPSVATVDKDGNVKAIGEGTAKIKVISNDNPNISAVCNVTVTAKKTEEPEPDKPNPDQPGKDDNNNNDGTTMVKPTLKLSKSKVTLYTGKASKSINVKATVTGISKTVRWTSKNPKVAKVLGGKIAAVKAGKTTVTASANGITRTVNVTVKNPTMTIKNGKKKFTKSKLTVKKNKKIVLKISVKPAKSGISISKFNKKQKKIASVTLKKGKLTIKGKKKGKFTITLKSGKAVKKIKLTIK